MLQLPKNPQLKDFQKYITQMEKERGFESETITQKALLLGEEVGELFKAIRKLDPDLKTDKNSKFGTVSEELADIFIYLCSIANSFDIDLERAFLEKEEKNKKRVWE